MPCFHISTGHNAWAGSCTYLAAAYAHTHEMKSFFFQVSYTAQSICVMGVATVNNNITFFKQWQQAFNYILNRFACWHQHHYFSWRL